MRWRWWRTADEMANDFLALRDPESDESFIASCELPDDPLALETAIAVRRSVANYGMVAAEYIVDTDRYPDELMKLSGWDSLDFVAWIFELEKELNEPMLMDTHYELRTPFSVKDLVWIVYRYRLRTRETNAKRIDG